MDYNAKILSFRFHLLNLQKILIFFHFIYCMLGRKTLLSLISLLFIRLTQGILLLIAVNRFLPIAFGYLTVAQSLLAFLIFPDFSHLIMVLGTTPMCLAASVMVMMLLVDILVSENVLDIIGKLLGKARFVPVERRIQYKGLRAYPERRKKLKNAEIVPARAIPPRPIGLERK